MRRLGGGTASAVHAVDVRLRNGSTAHLVLRRHLLFSSLADEPDLPEKEARNLQLIERAGIAAPRLVAVDPNGAECDVPAVLMTRVPGHLDLEPVDLETWLRRMAELLPPIHAIDPGHVPVQRWEIWDDLREVVPPPWSRRKDGWKQLIEIVRGPSPEYLPTFVHRDFQQYNVLWSRSRPTGVLDWANASMGPVELDFDHFRYNLLSAFGFDVAQRFLDVYREVTSTEPNAFWEALNFVPDRVATPQRAAELDAYMASLLARLS